MHFLHLPVPPQKLIRVNSFCREIRDKKKNLTGKTKEIKNFKSFLSKGHFFKLFKYMYIFLKEDFSLTFTSEAAWALQGEKKGKEFIRTEKKLFEA